MAEPQSVAPVEGSGNPFIGLRRFEIEDSPLFFGRNEQTYALLRRLRRLHFIALVGPSGCGKSSLVRAGVLAQLQNGYLAERGPWRIVLMQPGNAPLDEWTRALMPLKRSGVDASMLRTEPTAALDVSAGNIAILVDQFEELFQFANRTGRHEEVEQFLSAMLSTGAPDANIYLLLTMRSEYLEHCARYPELAEAVNEGLYLVPRMTVEQLRVAIVAPVQKAGALITESLVQRLLADVVQEEDALPVLQHALMRMWPERKPLAPLDLSLYLAAGNLGAYLDKHADSVYNSLTSQEQKAAESLFRCIAERTLDGRSVRRATEFDIIARETKVEPSILRSVIHKFQKERFLIVTPSVKGESDLVDISHEALTRQWKRMEAWLIAESQERRALSRLQDAAEEWNRNNRDKSYLIAGPRLARLQRELGTRSIAAGTIEQAFLKASIGHHRWKAYAPLVAGAVLVLIGIAVALWYWRLQIQSSEQFQAEAEAKRQVSIFTAQRTQAEARITQTEQYLENKPAEPAAAIKPRVYIQSWNPGQDKQMESAIKALDDKGYAVPKPERVSVGPASPELRYFRADERPRATAIEKILMDAGIRAPATYVGGFENSSRIRPGHFELWLARPDNDRAAAQVVILFLSESRQTEAANIAKVLKDKFDFTPDIQSYRAVQWKFISPTQLHYFHRTDAGEAGKIIQVLQDAGISAVSNYMAVEQRIPRRYFEIWLQAR